MANDRLVVERPDRGPYLTPYELAFGQPGFEARIFPGILREAEALGEDPSRWDRFGFLSRVSEALRDLVPPDAPLEMLEEYRCLFFHAFNFWRFGRRLFVLEQPTVRYLVEAAPQLDGWEFGTPHPSVYVQLPPRLFWASIATNAAPEPVDGFFATLARGHDPLGPAYGDLNVLMVLGVRRDRAGFSVIPFDTEVGPGISATWMEVPGREGAPDFANILPGGDMAGLYSILTNTEALKLLARTLWYIHAHPGQLLPESAAERRVEERAGSVPLSRLAYLRVCLEPGDSFTADGAAG
jgi:hypothetical protein